MHQLKSIFWSIIKKPLKPFKWFFNLTLKKKMKVGLITFFSLTLIGVAFLAVGYYAVVSGVFGVIPKDDELKAIKNYEASVVYSSDGVVLGRYYLENRTNVKYEDISPLLIKALIATEDLRFYEHKGIDQRGLMRVLFKSIILRQNAGGGSTLSQQLVKNVFGRKKYGFLTMPVNKMREAIIANKIEHLYTKKDILMLYLNTVSFGEDTYGIGTATERFFSTNPKNIQLEEIAVLIGMLKAPATYNPRTHPEKSLQRRNTVLMQLNKNGYISDEEKEAVIAKPLILKYQRLTNRTGNAAHFRAHLRQYLDQWLKEHPKEDGSYYNLYTDGLIIKTTINSKLQQYAEEAVAEHLSTLQLALDKDLKRNKIFQKNRTSVINRMKRTKRFKALVEQGFTELEVLKELEKPIKTTLYTFNGEKDTLISPKDSIEYYLRQLQAGFLVVNPSTGNIMVWVGGRSMEFNQYDHVLSKRQVGSVFKPIVYAQALRSGKQPCDFIANQAVIYTQYNDWSPKNSDNKYDGKYSLAGALANSVNTVSVKLGMDLGIRNVIGLAHELGVEEEFLEVPSLALGVSEISLMKLVGAYTSFANDGIYVAPQFMAELLDRDSNLIYKEEIEARKVLEKEVAHDLTNMLQGVVNYGTAARLRTRYHIKGTIAGKTGTTQDQKDGWFIGYTPNWIGGGWVGADYPFVHFSTVKQGQGANTALPIWAKFYKKVERDPSLNYLVSQTFDFPNTIDCPMYKEDNVFLKLFKKKFKKDRRSSEGKKRRRRRRK